MSHILAGLAGKRHVHCQGEANGSAFAGILIGAKKRARRQSLFHWQKAVPAHHALTPVRAPQRMGSRTPWAFACYVRLVVDPHNANLSI